MKILYKFESLNLNKMTPNWKFQNQIFQNPSDGFLIFLVYLKEHKIPNNSFQKHFPLLSYYFKFFQNWTTGGMQSANYCNWICRASKPFAILGFLGHLNILNQKSNKKALPTTKTTLYQKRFRTM